MEHYERDEIYAGHCKTYKGALVACPRTVAHIDALEVFVAALENKPVEPDLGALLVFFRSQLAKNIPLNWFCGKEVRRDLFEPKETVEFDLSSLRLFRGSA